MNKISYKIGTRVKNIMFLTKMNKNMNHKTIAVLLLLLPAVTLFTQENIKDTIHNSLIKNKLAFQYEAGYNFAGKSVIPIILSLKYHLSDKTALRFSAGFNHGNWGHGRMERMDTNNSYHNPEGEHFDHEGQNIEQLNFSLAYMLYPAPKKDINLFFGLGPRFGTGEEHFRPPGPMVPDNNGNDTAREFDNSSWSIGLTGIVGAEWFVNRSISLFTEYNLAAGYQQREYWDAEISVPGSPPTFTQKQSSGVRITDFSARLGFSIYFDRPF